MSLRRRSTTHDLAALRLHPDGSRVQQASVSSRPRTSKYTIVDSRGNRIARDAGGRNSVKRRRTVDVVVDGQERETIKLSPEDDGDDGDVFVRRRHRRTQSKGKGKQRADESENREDDKESDPEQLDARMKRRISFLRDFSFLDPPEVTIGRSFESKEPSDTTGISFSPPAPELLKSIHHFAACYYRERGQLFDRSTASRTRNRKKHNIYMMAADKMRMSETDNEMWEDRDDNESAEGGGSDGEGNGKDNARVASSHDPDVKDMYKAFDGSALMAIGILMQEQIAHILTSSSRVRQGPQG